ncbi:cation channel sperm-associated protein 1 isoform X2 [Tachyglossus aculeatus]|uniref:cation channel sperm-associated protein 1 isoform X2 n=1 Tax=Tachyglossus aculeatus TaxID=9261 RepID=UPI0018F57BA8|nr:cation channel sperm-associated protein 1 isoform X2 [Tachyglossus aculeatus]
MDYLTVPEVGQPKEGEQAALSAAASHKPPSQSQLAGPRSATSRPSAHHSAYSTSVFSRSQHGPRGGKSGSKSTTLIRSRRVGSADHDGPGHGYQREWYFTAADSVFLSIYLLEAVLKIISLGSNYFFNAWNKLDFFITIMALLDFVLPQIYNAMTIRHAGTNTFRVLKVFKGFRALRIFRVLRRLRFLNSLQEVTGTLARSLASIGAILVLMFICLFLFSVILRALFRNTDPKRFQSLFTTLFTLFTMLTLDDWSLIYLDSRAKGAWFIVPILMVYIIIQYFIFLNLVVAVLVDNFQMELLKGLEQEKQEKAALLQEKLLDDSLTKLQETDKQEEMQRITVQDQIEREMKGLTERQQQLYLTFLQLIAGVEVQQQQLRSQTAITEEIVDTVFEAGEEDLKK